MIVGERVFDDVVFEDVLVWIYKLGGNKNGKEK